MRPEQIAQINKELAAKIHNKQDGNVGMLAQYCKDFDAAVKEVMLSDDPKVMDVLKLQQEFINGVFNFANVRREQQ